MKRLVALLALAAVASSTASAADWPRFRGPGGLGIGESPVPLTWSGN